MSKLTVELLPHVANYTLTGEVIEFPQWALVVNGSHCGWVPKEGKHVSFFEHFNEQDRAAICAEVARQRGEKESRVESVPPSVLYPEQTEEDEPNED